MRSGGIGPTTDRAEGGPRVTPTIVERLDALEEHVETLHQFYDELIAELRTEAGEAAVDELAP